MGSRKTFVGVEEETGNKQIKMGPIKRRDSLSKKMGTLQLPKMKMEKRE